MAFLSMIECWALHRLSIIFMKRIEGAALSFLWVCLLSSETESSLKRDSTLQIMLTQEKSVEIRDKVLECWFWLWPQILLSAYVSPFLSL